MTKAFGARKSRHSSSYHGTPFIQQNGFFKDNRPGHGTSLQAKLRVGAPKDKYEQEADHVADQVMIMNHATPVKSTPAGSLHRKCTECDKESPVLQTKTLFQSITPLVQREANPKEEEVQGKFLQREAEEEKEVQRQEESEEKEKEIQTKRAGGNTPSLSPSVENGILSLRGGGRPLSESTRSFMEPRFGAGFGSVRVHTDSIANRLARSVNAKAFTVGKDIVFGAGEYSPDAPSGKRLLAHELTHVVQQGGGKTRQPALSKKHGFTLNRVPQNVLQRGEKWEQIKAVGPLDALRAKRDAGKAIKAAKSSGLPGLWNGPADAFRHAYWNCLMVKSIGYSQAETVARIHEKFGKNHPNERNMDDFNNAMGRLAGAKSKGGSCIKRVWTLIKKGSLKIIPNYVDVAKSRGKTAPLRPVLYKPGATIPARGPSTPSGSYY